MLVVQIGCYRGYVIPRYLEWLSCYGDVSAIREERANVGEMLSSQDKIRTSGVGQV